MNAVEIYENAIRMFEINGEITLGEFEEMIKPLEDVAPVVHGSWVFEKDLIIHGSCSVCGWTAHYCEDDVFGENYCPNCGARMDGVK